MSSKDELIESIKGQIMSAPEEERGEVFINAVAEIWGDDIGRAMGVINRSKSSILQKSNSKNPDEEEKQYLTRKLHEWLYVLILNSGKTVTEAVEVASEAFSITIEELNKSRNYVHAKGRMKEIVTVFDEHTVQKGMFEKGVVTKKELQGHSTPTGQLNRLSKGVKLYQTIVDLEDRVDNLETRERRREIDVQNLSEAVGVDPKKYGTTEERVRKCKEAGMKQKEAADYLEITTRTVRRYWNE